MGRHFSSSSVRIEPEGEDACILTAGGDQPQTMVLYFAMMGAEFEVLDPPEVREAARAVGNRLRRAGGSP